MLFQKWNFELKTLGTGPYHWHYHGLNICSNGSYYCQEI